MSQLPGASPIAVTGLSLLTPISDDLEILRSALEAGRSALSDPPDASGPASARIEDFDARRYANIRGMRVYPRNTQLQICAAAQALGHAGFALGQIPQTELGTITASTYAHTETLIEYDRGLVTLGVQRTNPTLFPLSLPSAPGALTALSLGAKAFAITVSDGDGSGLLAIGLGARLLAQGRAKVCVVVGAFTQCAELSASASRAGMLAASADVRPFDRQSRGTAFGELAGALVLEPAAEARGRGKEPFGYVHGHAATFAATEALRPAALSRACRHALTVSRLDAPKQLALISAGASGLPGRDEDEARGLSEFLRDAASEVPVTAVKSQLGESLDASGIAQVALALLQLRASRVSPVFGLGIPSIAGLRYQLESGPLSGTHALATSISQAGACAALTLSVTP